MSNDLRKKILACLAAGPVEAVDGTLAIEGELPELVHQTLVRMNERHEIGVYGAPNSHSDFGADPEVFFLKL